MEQHVSNSSRTYYYYLLNISGICIYLKDNATAKFILSLVSSRLGYCNGILAGIANHNQKASKFQNIAAQNLTQPQNSTKLQPCSVNFIGYQ